MGQYKFAMFWIKGFRIGFDFEWKWEINISLGFVSLYFGLTEQASGYNLFNKWSKI